MNVRHLIPISKPNISAKEIQAVVAVCKSGMLVQGKKVQELENAVAKRCGTKYAVAFNNGTAALHTALYAAGIGPGDEVITTPFTFVATANAILMVGAKPVFVDIEPETSNLDPLQIEKKITKRTKAILPVDLYGHMYDVPHIQQIAKKYKLKIIEDACQSIDAEYKNSKAGSFGDAGCFSFYATKNLMTGEGGMIVTNNKSIAKIAKQFRSHGQPEDVRYEYYHLGYNYRMMDMVAAIGLVQLERLEKFTKKRIHNASLLINGLKNLPGIVLPMVKKNYTHVFHQFTIRVTKDCPFKRDYLAAYLNEQGIGTGIHYPKPLHLYPHLKKYGSSKDTFSVSEEFSRQVLSLPVHPLVSKKDIHHIIKTIRGIYEKN